MANSPEKRLINKTVRNGTCWEWTGARNSQGYGLIRFKEKIVFTHRLAHLLFKGQNPGKLFVCHKCDNPPCINPAHLFLGTASDNAHDRRIKDRKCPQRIVFKTIKIKPIPSLTKSVYRKIISTNRPHSYFKKKFKLPIYLVKKIRRDAFWEPS